MKQKILNLYYLIIAKIAKFYIRKHKPEIIGITWSVWKTSGRMIIYDILKKYLKEKKVYTSSKNFNSEIGLVLSIFEIEKYSPSIFNMFKIFFKILFKLFFQKNIYDIIILEYWIDKIGDMDFLLKIAIPDISIMTKIDKVHCQKLENPQITAQEKFKLIYNTKSIVFLNYDDEFCQKAENIKVDKFYYTTTDNHQDNNTINILPSNYRLKSSNKKVISSFDINLNNQISLEIYSNLIWKENMWYIGIGLAILDILNFKFYKKSFLSELEWKKLELELSLQAWRFTILEWIKDSILIDSSYNSAPLSLKKTIENTYNLKTQLFQDYKIILAIWDMRELGEFSEQEHRSIAWISSQIADYIVLVWEDSSKYTLDELIKIWFDKNNIFDYMNSKDAGIKIKEIITSSDEKFIILFKWSQNTIFMERSIKQVLKNESDIEKLPRQSKFWMWEKIK